MAFGLRWIRERERERIRLDLIKRDKETWVGLNHGF
jgi:hypothetical protein